MNLIVTLAISYQYDKDRTGTKNTKKFKKIKNLEKDSIQGGKWAP